MEDREGIIGVRALHDAPFLQFGLCAVTDKLRVLEKKLRVSLRSDTSMEGAEKVEDVRD